MSSQLLTERQIQILRSLRDNASGGNKQLFDQVLSGALPRSDIETICHKINDEYLMKGIKEDYSPNEYGRELEGLIDLINKPRIAP
jgi:hypothetical protein